MESQPQHGKAYYWVLLGVNYKSSTHALNSYHAEVHASEFLFRRFYCYCIWFLQLGCLLFYCFVFILGPEGENEFILLLDLKVFLSLSLSLSPIFIMKIHQCPLGLHDEWNVRPSRWEFYISYPWTLDHNITGHFLNNLMWNCGALVVVSKALGEATLKPMLGPW
jgi:hypothetical protein